jgi:hypothetical protein
MPVANQTREDRRVDVGVRGGNVVGESDEELREDLKRRRVPK